MRRKTGLRHSLIACAMAGAMVVPSFAQACTSLLYTGGKGTAYSGRTLELSRELPYPVDYFPVGTSFGSKVSLHHTLDFKTKNTFVAIGVPSPTDGQTKVVQGAITRS